MSLAMVLSPSERGVIADGVERRTAAAVSLSMSFLRCRGLLQAAMVGV